MRELNDHHISTVASIVRYVMVRQGMVGWICSIPSFKEYFFSECSKYSALYNHIAARFKYFQLHHIVCDT